MAKKKEATGCCPNCGYCRHCGRGGHVLAPYVIPYPYQPAYQPVIVTYPSQPYVFSGTVDSDSIGTFTFSSDTPLTLASTMDVSTVH